MLKFPSVSYIKTKKKRILQLYYTTQNYKNKPFYQNLLEYNKFDRLKIKNNSAQKQSCFTITV